MGSGQGGGERGEEEEGGGVEPRAESQPCE